VYLGIEPYIVCVFKLICSVYIFFSFCLWWRWGRTCREHDGMWPSKLRHSRSTGRRVTAFRIYSNMAACPPFWII